MDGRWLRLRVHQLPRRPCSPSKHKKLSNYYKTINPSINLCPIDDNNAGLNHTCPIETKWSVDIRTSLIREACVAATSVNDWLNLSVSCWWQSRSHVRAHDTWIHFQRSDNGGDEGWNNENCIASRCFIYGASTSFKCNFIRVLQIIKFNQRVRGSGISQTDITELVLPEIAKQNDSLMVG